MTECSVKLIPVFRLAPQQHFILVCLSRPVGAHMHWEKDSGEARKTKNISGQILVYLLVFWISLAFEWQSLCYLKLSLKNLSVHFFQRRVSTLDPWTFDVSTSAPAVASVADDSCNHLEMGKIKLCFCCHLLVLHIEATGTHLKASQTEVECGS